MAPVAGRPFLEILLSELARKGFSRVVLSVGYLSDEIVRHFGSRFRTLSVTYVRENQPLGTGGAIRLALTQCVADHTFVFNGDTFLDLEAAKVEIAWRTVRRPIVVGREVEDTKSFGRLLVNGGRVVGFTEKGISGPGLINAGCYVFNRHQLDAFPINEPFSIERDYFHKFVSTVHVDVFRTGGMFIDIGVPADYLRANELLEGRI